MQKLRSALTVRSVPTQKKEETGSPSLNLGLIMPCKASGGVPQYLRHNDRRPDANSCIQLF